MLEPYPEQEGSYAHADAGPATCHPYLLPVVLRELRLSFPSPGTKRDVFDLGCGSGFVANELHRAGFDVTGVDPSSSGMKLARARYPHLRLHPGSGSDDLSQTFGQFSAVISLEVIEHVYAPRAFARNLRRLMRPGGAAIVSTPYHGYWKNLAIAISGATDRHLDPLWDGGHIKFWSIDTLTRLFSEAGLAVKRVHRVGRIPVLAKSMIFVLERPAHLS